MELCTVLSQSVHGTATYKCDDTRDCIIKCCPPDDEHMFSKHVEAWNKLIIKFSASSWLISINKPKNLFKYSLHVLHAIHSTDTIMYARCVHLTDLTDLPKCFSRGRSGARVLLENMFWNLTSAFQGLSEPRDQMPIELGSFLWLPFAYTTFAIKCTVTLYRMF